MSKYIKYTQGRMVFWVYPNRVIIRTNALQVVRYDIYTTANKRNFYTFKKELVKRVLSDKDVTIYDIFEISQQNRITGVAAREPEE